MKELPMNKISINTLVVALVASTTLAGCATVFDGGNQSVDLRPSTVGENVNVKVSTKGGTQTVKVPANVSVARDKSTMLVTVDDPCYEPNQIAANSSVNPWAIGNVLFGLFGLTGTTVDMSTGNAWKYDETITVPTVKKASCGK
ncbi:MAG: hypothetical protein EOP52_13650 [Sphingobacteriales bacterium]|nr:MAG: hypothetical protein EOP52_13650 [Sphingobacteriales bacterium]